MKGKDACVFAFLIGLGTMQMAADVMGLARVKAVAAALQLSPAMKVFTAHEGYETYAAHFTVHWQGDQGAPQVLRLGPTRQGAIRGPYNRRNVYGAALAYGPLLRRDPRTRVMHDSVMHYAFCRPGALREEFGIPAEATRLRIVVRPVRADARRDLPLSWELPCHG